MPTENRLRATRKSFPRDLIGAIRMPRGSIQRTPHLFAVIRHYVFRGVRSCAPSTQLTTPARKRFSSSIDAWRSQDDKTVFADRRVTAHPAAAFTPACMAFSLVIRRINSSPAPWKPDAEP